MEKRKRIFSSVFLFIIITITQCQSKIILETKDTFMVPLKISAYFAHLGNIDGKQNQWIGMKDDSVFSKLQGFSIRTGWNNQDDDVHLEYFADIQGIDETINFKEGQFIGERGSNTKIVQFGIKVVGMHDQIYDVYYQAFISGVGQTKQFKNGQICGNKQYSRNIQAIKIKLVKRLDHSVKNQQGQNRYSELRLNQQN